MSINLDKNIHINLQQDPSVRNRLFTTKKARVVEATGFVHIESNDHYIEAKDQQTGVVQLYAKRNLRPRGYVQKQHPLGSLAELV